MPKHLNFKKRDQDEKTYTFSCNVRKVLGNTAINEGVHIKFETPSSPKNILLKQREIFPDLCQCLSLNEVINVGINT
jgi:hypothetical protein